MNFEPTNIKGIFFDLDDTLYDYAHSNTIGKQASFAYLSSKVNRTKEDVETYFNAARDEIKQTLEQELGFESAQSHSRLLYFLRTIELMTDKTNSTIALECEKIFWDNFINNITPFPNMIDFIKKIKSLGKKIVIVTDMTARVQLEKLIKLKIDTLIDLMVSSEESGREKPHPASLLLGLKKCKLHPREVVMIGENEKRDIAAASTIGILPIAFRNKPTQPQVLNGKNFKQVLNCFDCQD